MSFHEDAAARRALAARTMRWPLVALKFGSPALMMAALAIIVSQPNLAAQPLDVLALLALPFGVPFILAAIYPIVRWMPQEWTLDEHGISGHGRVGGHCPWTEVQTWRAVEPAESFGHAALVFRRAPSWRHLRTSMMVPAAYRAAVERWFETRGRR